MLRHLRRHLSLAAAVAAGGGDEQLPAAAAAAQRPGWLAQVPPYFVKEGLEAFRALPMDPSDVVMVSYPKCGTSWLHQILFCLLRMSEDGTFPRELEGWLGSSGQVYPDGIPAAPPGVPNKFSGSTVHDMAEQESPRLFTTHIRAGNLPPSLLTGADDAIGSTGGAGRMVVICRNPKDACVSGYYFAKKLSEGPYPQLKPVVEKGLQGAWEGYLRDTDAQVCVCVCTPPYKIRTVYLWRSLQGRCCVYI